jgi:hypothetical protein
VRYEPARNPPTARGCQTGTLALGRAVRAAFPELQTLTGAYGCFNPRRIAGSSRWSLHAEGRALDVGVPIVANAIGWELACILVRDRITYGTMRVMWDKHIWSTERPADWRRLQPQSQQHTDHVHIEQFWAHATKPAVAQHAYEAALIEARHQWAAGK